MEEEPNSFGPTCQGISIRGGEVSVIRVMLGSGPRQPTGDVRIRPIGEKSCRNISPFFQ
jgi:hypothetical protein